VDVDERHQQMSSGSWTGMAAGQNMSNQNMSNQNMSGSSTTGAQNMTNQDMTSSSTAGQNMTGRGSDMTNKAIPIIEENLQVGKREVETGGARLRSRIIEKPVEEHLRLRQEHVWIERNPVNRPASEADIQGFREGEIEMTEHAEVPVVNKEARVVEEIRMGMEVEERDETVRGTVRRTDVDVERLEGDNDMRQQRGTSSSDRDDINRGSGL
jgi:stress response protein YsnF